MAFCTTCGKSLEEGARFCTNCGNAVQVAAPENTQSVTTSSAPAGSSAAAAAAPAPVEIPPPIVPPLDTSSTDLPVAPRSSLSQFFVVICIALVLLAGAGVSAMLYLRNQSRPKVAAAAAEAAAASAQDSGYIQSLNLGSYPGATPVAIATLNGETVVAGFVTRDRPDQVVQFYKVRFPVSEVTADSAGSHLSATLTQGQRIRIDAEPQGAGTQVKVVLPN